MSLITSQRPSRSVTGQGTFEKKPILFLEQQSWLSGAQKVLEYVLDSIIPEYQPIVAFPNEGAFREKLQARGIETIHYPLGNYQSGQKSFPEMISFAARSVACGLELARLIRRKRIALIYVNGPRCLPAGVLASRLTGCPLLFHLHLTLCRKPEVMMVAHLARYAAKIISCSRAAGQPLVNANPILDKGLLVRFNPLNPVAGSGAADIMSPSARFTLGMVGRVTETKGQFRSVAALGALHPTLQKQLRLVIVGAPSPGSSADLAYVFRVQQLAVRLKLQDRIIWAGYQADPTPYYAAMDVLLQPSSDQAGEGMPMSILEVLREGVPVIASRTGGIPEVIQDGVNGLLVPPGDDAALVQALQRFLEDDSLRARLRAGTRETLTEQFSLETFQSQMRESIRELCNSNAPQEAPASRGESAA